MRPDYGIGMGVRGTGCKWAPRGGLKYPTANPSPTPKPRSAVYEIWSLILELDSFSISSTESCKVEHLWLEITRFGNKVILGGIYRHPNHNILDFTSKFKDELNKISSQTIPCVVAGVFNIDLGLLKFDNHTATKDFLHSLLTNNFTPTVLLPSWITSKSTSLIDHIYINKGQKNSSAWFDPHIKSDDDDDDGDGDISDHLPCNLTLILNNPTYDIKLRHKVRILSKKQLY